MTERQARRMEYEDKYCLSGFVTVKASILVPIGGRDEIEDEEGAMRFAEELVRARLHTDHGFDVDEIEAVDFEVDE